MTPERLRHLLTTPAEPSKHDDLPASRVVEVYATPKGFKPANDTAEIFRDLIQRRVLGVASLDLIRKLGYEIRVTNYPK